MNARILLMMVAALGASGCSRGPTRFDASTDATAHASIVAMMDELGPARSAGFPGKAQAVAADLAGFPREGAGDAEVHRPLHGMTASEILDRASAIGRRIADRYHLEPPGDEARRHERGSPQVPDEGRAAGDDPE